MGWFRRRAAFTAELTELRVLLAELRAQIAAEQRVSSTLQFRLHDLERRNHELAIRSRPVPDQPPASHPAPTPAPQPSSVNATLTPPPAPPPAAAVFAPPPTSASPSVAAEQTQAIGELRVTLEHLNRRLDELAATFQSQLHDLGYEIELAAAATRATAAATDLAQDRQMDALREAQVRLAGEQARYEIALRAELAGLADRIRQL